MHVDSGSLHNCAKPIQTCKTNISIDYGLYGGGTSPSSTIRLCFDRAAIALNLELDYHCLRPKFEAYCAKLDNYIQLLLMTVYLSYRVATFLVALHSFIGEFPACLTWPERIGSGLGLGLFGVFTI